ncbi:hypothetical protein [Gluconobacter cadivus]|uniref:Uncharacterized protein n=1 Tax=Gluconobacter cadivus TaxID=2728101 RepID=A0ABR9YZ03_9PROT|nr:hypothetical protein [Gluconobacter cadivus]MBF0889782.1 hypothetical protein [Gluconobacter cadivus]
MTDNFTLSFDELVSIRNYLVATVLDFSDATEISILGMFSDDEILMEVIKIKSFLLQNKKEYNNVFSSGEYKLIKSCLYHGNLALGIYDKYKPQIDYGSCIFSDTAERLLNYINSDTVSAHLSSN